MSEEILTEGVKTTEIKAEDKKEVKEGAKTGTKPDAKTDELENAKVDENVSEELKYSDKDLNDKLSARITKELAKIKAGLLKKAGVTDEAQLEELKKLQDAQLTEAEKIQKQIAEKDAELLELKTKTEQAEAKAEAMSLGVDPAKIERVVKLVAGYDGETTSDKVKAFIAENPEFVKKESIQDLGVPSGGQKINEYERVLALARQGAGLAKKN